MDPKPDITRDLNYGIMNIFELSADRSRTYPLKFCFM